MKKYISYLAVFIIIFLLSGCAAPSANPEDTAATQSAESAATKAAEGDASAIDSQNVDDMQEKNVSKYLFVAGDVDTIQLTGQEILDGKEADMSVKISDSINMDFHISRDNPNGTKLYIIYNSSGYNLAMDYIKPEVFDNDEAIPEYSYQICCYDFDNDGTKEVVVAAGNKVDKLSVFVFRIDVESQQLCYPENYILGYKNAYVNEKNEICIPSPKGVKPYKYNIQAEDAEAAKLSGPAKITIDYATQQQLERHKNSKTFKKDEGALKLIVLPEEKLKDVKVYSIEYDANTEKHHTTSVLYSIPEITPDSPLIVQAYLTDFPSLGVSYTDDDSGREQLFGICESLKDGTVYLFEMKGSTNK